MEYIVFVSCINSILTKIGLRHFENKRLIYAKASFDLQNTIRKRFFGKSSAFSAIFLEQPQWPENCGLEVATLVLGIWKSHSVLGQAILELVDGCLYSF